MRKVVYQNEKGEFTYSYKVVQKWKADGIAYTTFLIPVEKLSDKY